MRIKNNAHNAIENQDIYLFIQKAHLNNSLTKVQGSSLVNYIKTLIQSNSGSTTMKAIINSRDINTIDMHINNLDMGVYVTLLLFFITM